MKTTKIIPQPDGHWLWGHLSFVNNPLLYLRQHANKYPKIYKIRLLFTKLLFLVEPEYIKHVMQTNNKNYVKGFGFDELRLLVIGVFTTDGETWFSKRRLMQPAFHRERLANLSTEMVNCVVDLLNKLAKQPKGESLDLHHLMMDVALRIVCQTTMGIHLEEEVKKVDESMTFLMKELYIRANSALKIPLWIPTSVNRDIKKYTKQLHEVAKSVIQQRRKMTQQPDDLLKMLMETQDADTGERMNDEEIRHELLTILLAGHETSANALTFIWYLLSQHPTVKEKFHEELRSVLNGRTPTLEDLKSLTYTTQIIYESMRVYPPVYSLTRKALNDDEIDGYKIKKGKNIIISPYNVHHCEQYWPKAEEFNPERFTAAKMKEMHKYAYFPFGGGPRICLGNNFALMEMQIILAMLGQKYDFRPVNNEVTIEPALTIRPQDGLWVYLD